MTGRTIKMLQTLRDAIHEALAESPEVAAAMSELERAGHVPAFSVDVSLPTEKITDSGGVVSTGELLLTIDDESFLRDLGIAAAS